MKCIARVPIFVILNFLRCYAGYIEAPKLGAYGADSNGVSVSGISSGAYMATQMHVAHSALFKGVGIVSGGPYYCCKGDSTRIPDCTVNGSKIDALVLVDMALAYAEIGQIDSADNLRESKVYIICGTLDSRVTPETTKKAEEFYDYFVENKENIKAVYDLQAAHTFPTESYGTECTVSERPWIAKCGYNTAFEILNHIYGNLKRPTEDTKADGLFTYYDQGEFIPEDSVPRHSLDAAAMAYIPTKCITESGCKVHVAFHGCKQGRDLIEEKFARHTGYNEVGELNDIIILYPQIVPNDVNLHGCWDWYGFTGPAHATKEGVQISTVFKTVQRVLRSRDAPEEDILEVTEEILKRFDDEL